MFLTHNQYSSAQQYFHNRCGYQQIFPNVQ
uniref:Uncharacterized protein n=1 Tax=Anguilla anguilla TaxID=7936 RepID=A0A0E9XU24_ANGAN